jgi:monoamine oxidase
MSGDSTVGLTQEQCDFVVVGAGFAGLTAALRLSRHGSVIVLEARDYVGGRVLTNKLADGTWLDEGGTWFGPGQDYAYALAREMKVNLYPTYYKGDTVLLLADGTRVVSSDPENFPLMAICEAVDALWVLTELEEMAKEVPLDKPWNAPKAREWDQQTFAAWVDAQVDDAVARETVKTVMEGYFTCDPAEFSLLDALYLIHSHHGFAGLASTHGGDQQDRVEGGMQSIAHAIHHQLGKAVRLSSPVRVMRQVDGGVEAVYDGGVVRAKFAVVAMPPTVAGRISYDPPLPVERAMLVERAPSGEVIKFLLAYETPFWRKDGYSGMSGAVAHPITMTIDGSTNRDNLPALLIAFASGRHARAYAKLPKEERKQRVLDTLATRFNNPLAKTPIGYFEHDWSDDPWSGGGMIVHFPPGVLTNFGPALTACSGLIHWAGSESSGAFHCSINAAIASGDRACRDIVAAMKGSGPASAAATPLPT